MIKYDPEKNPWQCHLCIFKMRRTIESTNWECGRGEDIDDCTFREIYKSGYEQALKDVEFERKCKTTDEAKGDLEQHRKEMNRLLDGLGFDYDR